jgi:uncharacterized delta-60 repeat protein
VNWHQIMHLAWARLGVLAAGFCVASASAEAAAPSILVPPSSQVVMAGQEVTFSVAAAGDEPLSFQWRLAETNLPDAIAAVLTLPNVSSVQGGGYSVVITNYAGSITSAVATLTVVPALPGALEGSFRAVPGADDLVRVVRALGDGRVLIGGAFTSVNGVPRNHVARLKSDGSLDPDFDPGPGPDGNVYCLAGDEGGKVLIGGSFRSVNGTTRNYLARLNIDGSLDQGFDPGSLLDGTVWSIARQSDGRVVIGGDFANAAGAGLVATSNFGLTRLDATGQLDKQFLSDPTLSGRVRCVTLDGARILAGGLIYRSGSSLPRLVCLKTTGSVDPDFSAVAVDSWIFTVTLQTNGAILMGGSFTKVNDVGHASLARLDGNGSLDSRFTPSATGNGAVTSLAVQSDGRILLGGGFTTVNGAFRERIARLYGDGSLDAAFRTSPGPNDWVESIALQSDGRILIAGNFVTVGGAACGRVARLVADEPPPFLPVISQAPSSESVGEGADVVFHGTGIAFPPPAFQWQVNGVNLPGATNEVLQLFNVRTTNAGSYTLVLSNVVGSVTSAVATLLVEPAPTFPGATDIDFYAGSGANGSVRAIAVQTNGGVLIGGFFSMVDGVPRAGLARLQSNGSLDPGFNPNPAMVGLGAVYAAKLQSDGAILVGGASYYNEYGNGPPQLIRLNADGTRDIGFMALASHFSGWGSLYAIETAGDGGIFIGGRFLPGVARLLHNGLVDTNFSASIEAYGTVYALAVQRDGKVIIGGEFAAVSGLPRNRIARLNLDGSVDETFYIGSGANGTVRSLALQSDGSLMVAGDFSRINGRPCSRLARLTSDGLLDESFDIGLGPNHNLNVVSVQLDGRLLVGGWFSGFDDYACSGLVRLRSDGSLDLSFNPGAGRKVIYAIAQQADGKVLVGGGFYELNGVPRAGIGRLLGGDISSVAPYIAGEPLSRVATAGADVTFRVIAGGVPSPSYRWQYGQYPTSLNQWWLTLYNVQPGQAGPYRVRVNNPLGSVLSAVAWLTVVLPGERAGAPDINFYAGFGPNDRVNAVLVQPDHRVLIAGEFTEVDGVPCNRVARLEPNGNLDFTFNPGFGANRRVCALALQEDGRILLGGDFTSINGTNRNHVARLQPDGSLDLGFDPGTGVNGPVYALAVQSDLRILAGGSFATNAGAQRVGLARFDPDGRNDGSFQPAPILNGPVRCLAVQTNGSILVGGDFTYFSGASRQYLARFDRYGGPDTGFLVGAGPNLPVQCLAVRPDGKILIGGMFTYVNGVARNGCALLSDNGAVDPAFSDPRVLGTVYAMALRGDGRVVVAGSFTSAGGLDCNHLARLNSNGSLDLAFDAGLGVTGGTSFFDEYGSLVDRTVVQSIAVSNDGTLVIGGDFGQVNGMSRSFVARLFNYDPAVRLDYRPLPAPPGQGLELRWESGVLQQASELPGPWFDVPGSASPYQLGATNAQRFFRVRQ